MSRKRTLFFLASSLLICAFASIAYVGFLEYQKMNLYSIRWQCITKDRKFNCEVVRYRLSQKTCGVYIAQMPNQSGNSIKPPWLDIQKTPFPWRMTVKIDGKRISFKEDVVSIRCTDLNGEAFSKEFPALNFPPIKQGVTDPVSWDMTEIHDIPAIFDICTKRDDEQIDGHEAADRPL